MMTHFHSQLPYCCFYDKNEVMTEIVYVYFFRAGWQITIFEEIVIYHLLSFRLLNLHVLLVKILKVKFQYLLKEAFFWMSKFINQYMTFLWLFLGFMHVTRDFWSSRYTLELLAARVHLLLPDVLLRSRFTRLNHLQSAFNGQMQNTLSTSIFDIFPNFLFQSRQKNEFGEVACFFLRSHI